MTSSSTQSHKVPFQRQLSVLVVWVYIRKLTILLIPRTVIYIMNEGLCFGKKSFYNNASEAYGQANKSLSYKIRQLNSI